MKYLILFDIDGTIMRFKRRFAKRLFSQVMHEFFDREVPDEVLDNFGGMTDLSILRIMAESIEVKNDDVLTNIDSIWRRLREVFHDHINQDNLYLIKGADEIIKHFHEDPLVMQGLITGNFKENAYKKVDAFGLAEYFPIGGFGSDHEDRNHLPMLAIERANKYAGEERFHVGNTLIIGDTFRDIECAKVNNIRILAVATGEVEYDDLAKGMPDRLVANFDDVNDTIEIIHELLGYGK